MDHRLVPPLQNSLITVFIPVFNGSHYLPQTIKSLRQQTYINFEVILIDDHSTDGSFEVVIQETIGDSRFRIMQTPKNLGNAARVLKYGFNLAQGDYFVYSSQDDLFSSDWLAEMHSRSIETGAEAVLPDLVFYNPSQLDKQRALIGVNGKKDIILSGRDAFLLSLNWKIPGNALWKVSLLRKIGWFDFAMNADEYSVREFFINCNCVAFSKGTFYYRQDNPEAITKKMSIQSFSLPYTDLRLWRLSADNDFEKKIQLMLLNRSISGLMYYTNLAYSRKYKTAIPAIKRTFKEYTDNDASTWLGKNADGGLISLFNQIAIRSYAIFVLTSILRSAIRRVVR